MADQQQDQGQKTEQPSPQRLRQAREEGNIGFSSELIAAAILLCASTFGFLFMDNVWLTLSGTLKRTIEFAPFAIESPMLLVMNAKQSTMLMGTVAMGFACAFGAKCNCDRSTSNRILTFHQTTADQMGQVAAVERHFQDLQFEKFGKDSFSRSSKQAWYLC